MAVPAASIVEFSKNPSKVVDLKLLRVRLGARRYEIQEAFPGTLLNLKFTRMKDMDGTLLFKPRSSLMH
jgi:hypothetical protein